jgi:hypothetical protein
MSHEPDPDWSVEDQLILLLMKIDAKLEVLIGYFEEDDGEEADS